MNKVKVTLYLEPEVETALREFAGRERISLPKATNRMLRRALFDALDPGTEAMLLPEIRAAVGAVTAREVRENVTRLLEAQTNRLAALLVTSGRDAYVARRLARDCYEDLTDDPGGADERERDAWLKSRTRYTRDGLRGATADPQGTGERGGG